MQPPAAVIRRILREPSSLTGADLPWIRSMNLGGYVYQRLPSDHPLRPTLRSDVLQLSTRHALIRRELRALLELWQNAGVPVMLLKGFALAEFEYGTPGERFYGDVDLLLPNDPDLISRAVHLAIAQGWRSDGQHARPELWTHECAHLYSPGGHVKLDVHRFVLAWFGGPQARVQDVTRQLWENAVATNWEGLRVTLPAPVDRAVITLALGRCWGGDSGGLKPADPVDLRLLRERHQLTPQALMRRAQELGASHTWATFEALCSP
ncbi:MAG: nucleotidyltransferase family protein, partial [Deinococcus sp.]|nr:nucleotidyltransferase family protein [Deinococcus sp.]